MQKKIKVGVIYGGPSGEHEVSLVTGRAVCENLDKNKYIVVPLVIGKKDNKLPEMIFTNKIDIFFIALHGTFGEDGTIQALLESQRKKYTGSNVLASALSMNKVMSSKIYLAANLPSPAFVDFKKNEWREQKFKILTDIKKQIRYPCVLKPVDQGSALGVEIVSDEAELSRMIEKNIKQFNWLMVQTFIKGREATNGVLEKKGEPFALPPMRIISNLGEFYNYQSKYAAGGSTHVCPADFTAKDNKKIQNLALCAHKVLGCRGMSRTDIMVDEKGKMFILETNTIPGMTPTSLLPEAAAKAGIAFSEMLDLIVQASL